MLDSIALNGLYLFGACIVALLCVAFIAPIGTLRWWVHGTSRRFEPAPLEIMLPDVPPPSAQHYIVYISGIGNVSRTVLPDEELNFLQHLATQMPNTILISDVFGFSVMNQGLTDEHWLGRFWLWLHTSKLQQRHIGPLGNLINARNALQLLVAADKRYGPIYSYATASTILRTLVQHGYVLGSGTAVTLLGYSGGSQIALGAATYLKPTLNAPLQLISLAGVLNDDPGIDALDRIRHLVGERDTIEPLGTLLFPGRWKRWRQSRWNMALASGKLQRIAMGPMTHAGRSSYFDPDTCFATGQCYLDCTVERICHLITEPEASTQESRTS